ncbi:hypothetical protein [Acinetobacter thutiue]|uniref:hypothetical protein n=1 Tax=Acinetobacter thutiue TaxID=2998078 RepID=UPI00398CA198
MLPKDQEKLCKIIYSPDHHKDWQKIARSSKQYDANDIAQNAFLFVIDKWMDEFDLCNPKHWVELKQKMWSLYGHGVDRVLKKALSMDQTSRNDPDEAINPILLGISSPTSTESLQGMIDVEE